MSYTKQNFVSGQILKAEHLNHMEDGIEANDAAVAALSEEIVKLPEQVKQEVLESLTKFDVEGDFVTFTPKEGAAVHVVTSYSGYAASNTGRYLQHVTSKNLYNFAERIGGVGTVIEKGGLTATVNADHTLTVVGTNETDGYVSLLSLTNDAPYNRYVFPAGTYTVPAGTGFTLQCASPDSATSYGNKTGTFTIDAPFIIRGVVLNYAPGKEVNTTIPLVMVRGTTMPDSYEYVGQIHVIGIPSGYPEGTINWTTGELFDAEGNLVGAYPAPSITGLAGENIMWIGAGSVHAEGDTADLSIGGGSAAEAFDPAMWGLPVLYLTGSTTAMSKDNAVDLSYRFGTRSGSCAVKWQGSSSLQWPKKNYTVKFDNAFEAKEGWGEQKKYCMKANYIDFTHARNVVGAILWGQVVKSRVSVPTELANLPNGGAIDGFPILIVINDEFKGVYTMNIPKDGWMYGMGSGTNECILCANQVGQSPNFKGEATLTDDLEIEYITDENDTAWAITSINNLINACINSDGSDLDTTIAAMLDWDSAIDYYIYTVLTIGHDGMTKNYLLYTFDGTKWGFGAYDLDCNFCLSSDGKTFLPADFRPSFEYFANVHRAMELIATYKKDQLKARYAELRAGVLSESNVAVTFANFMGGFPLPVMVQEAKIWPTIPNTNANDLGWIRGCYSMRCALADKWIEEL